MSSLLGCAMEITPTIRLTTATPEIAQPRFGARCRLGGWRLETAEEHAQHSHERQHHAQRLQAEIDDAVNQHGDQPTEQGGFDPVLARVADDKPDDHADAGDDQRKQRPSRIDQPLERLVLEEREPERKRGLHRPVDGKDAFERAPPDAERVRGQHAESVAPQREPDVTADAAGPESFHQLLGAQGARAEHDESDQQQAPHHPRPTPGGGAAFRGVGVAQDAEHQGAAREGRDRAA